MSDHQYIPRSKFGKWFNDRLPLLTLSAHLREYPTPKNLNYWWTFGGILTFCLVAQIVTGLILAMHYVAHSDLAFESLGLLNHTENQEKIWQQTRKNVLREYQL